MPVTRFKIVTLPIIAAGFYLLFVALYSRNLADYDLWGYLAFGRIFWEEGYFPYQDVFSYTPTKGIWVYHEWLTGVCFYPIYKYAGPAGLQLFRYLIVVATIYLIYLTGAQRGGKPVWGLISLIPAIILISFGYVPVRAQIFTYLFFILTLYILENARKIQKWTFLWWLLPIQLLWCNLHGGFLAGLGLILFFALGEGLSGRRFFPFIKIAVLAVLVTLINPYGIHYWLYIFPAVSMPRPDINEWSSVITAINKGIYGLPVFVFILMAIIFVFFYIFRRKRGYTDLLIGAAIIYLGFKHIRHSVFFGLVFGSFLPLILTEYWAAWRERRFIFTSWAWLPQLILGVLLVSVYFFINPSLSIRVSPSFEMVTPSPAYPTGAFRWIKANRFQGNILPHFEWGEFLIWYCNPGCRVAMDGRYETVYEDHVSKEYFLFLLGKEGGREFLQKYPHDMVLIKPNTAADFMLGKEKDWEKAYSDLGSVVYLRQTRDQRQKGDGSKGDYSEGLVGRGRIELPTY